MISIFKNISLLTISELIEKAIIFFLFIYMGRVFSPVEFGYLNYILAILSYFIIFIDLGLPQLSTREISSHYKLASSFFDIIFIIKLLLFFIIAIIWIFFIITTQNEFLNIGLLLLFYLFARVIDIFWYLQGLQKFKDIVFIKLFKASILSVSFVILYLYPSLEYYFILLILSLIIPFAWYIYINKLITLKLFNKIKFLFVNNKRIKVLISRSLPLIVSTFLILMYYNLDTILIEFFINLEAVARYNAAYKIIFAFIVVRSVFTSVIFPRIAKDKLSWSEGSIFLIIGFSVAVVIGIFSYIYASDLLFLAYSDKYLSSSLVFIILSMTASVLWINLFFPIFFIAIKKDIFYMKVHIVTAFLNLIGNLFLIPLYGIEGAAIATLVADIASLLIFGFYYFKIKYKRCIT
jgi:O-antigen/teichoic acid export membrane protein